MPIHDWTRVPAGTFHFFHQRWIQDIAAALNNGGLPPGYFAMTEVEAKGPVPDDLALKVQTLDSAANLVGVNVLESPPKTREMTRGDDTARYARRADRIAIHLAQGELVAAIELISPGNKSITNALKTFVRKAGMYLRRCVHLLVVDLFPPGPRDPIGIHKAIWESA